MRKALASVGLATMLSMGMGHAVAAPANHVHAAQTETTNTDDTDNNDDSGKLGLIGLVGLLGLAGLARKGDRAPKNRSYGGGGGGGRSSGGRTDWSNR